MAKCRGLLQENQELGKQISQGRVTQLEAEITLHKKYNQEIKQAQEGVYSMSLLSMFAIKALSRARGVLKVDIPRAKA